MHITRQFSFFSILSLSLAAAPPNCGRHGSLQARGCLGSKNYRPGRTDSVVNKPPVVGQFYCSGPTKHFCETHCACDQHGKVVCDKNNPYSKLFTLKSCAPQCSCVVDGVRRVGVWDGEHQKALELELKMHYHEGAGVGPSNAGDPGAGPSNAGPSNAGDPGAGPSNAGDPGAGPSNAGPSNAGDPGAGPSNAEPSPVR